MKILKDMKRAAGCDNISDLKYLDRWIMPAFKKMKWEKYSAEEIKNGSYSTGYQLSGRELLDQAEVRMLDNNYALLFITGELAVKDLKYDILKHPNIKLTEDGGAKPYIHGVVEDDIADISMIGMREIKKDETLDEGKPEETGYELLSDEDLLSEIEKEEKENDEKKKRGN